MRFRKILQNKSGYYVDPLQNMNYNKSGQVTIFIVIAIVIVAAILIAYLGGWLKVEQSTTNNPKQYMESCILNSIKTIEKSILESNTYPNFNSSNYILFKNEKIPYLCVASEFYKPCIPQDPALFSRLKKLMENKVAVDTTICLNKLYKDLDSENYQITKKSGEVKLDITPDEIIATLNETIYFVKGENSYSISGFQSDYQTKIYEMLKLEQTIVNYESTFCEFNKMNWMNSYPSVIISRDMTSDQTKVYTLKDRLTDRQIKFAIKTCVLPAGL
jgi:hypothetical protein